MEDTRIQIGGLYRIEQNIGTKLKAGEVWRAEFLGRLVLTDDNDPDRMIAYPAAWFRKYIACGRVVLLEEGADNES